MPKVKLTEEKLLDMLKLYEEGVSSVALAKRYNVHPSTINRAISKRVEKDFKSPFISTLTLKDKVELRNVLMPYLYNKQEINSLVSILDAKFDIISKEAYLLDFPVIEVEEE